MMWRNECFMSEEIKQAILAKARTLIGPPIGFPERVIPVFQTNDEALRTGQIGFWIRSEYFEHSEELEEQLWQQAKEALNL